MFHVKPRLSFLRIIKAFAKYKNFAIILAACVKEAVGFS